MAQFDAIAGDYARLQQEGGHASMTRDLLRELVPQPLRGRKVLDAGCGPGIDAAWLEDQGAHVVAIDESIGMVREAERLHADARYRAIKFLRRDLTNTQFAGNLFDGVYSRFALDFSTDLDAAFGELHRVLRPGGWLVCAVDHPAYLAALATHQGRTDGKASIPIFGGNISITKPLHTFEEYGRAIGSRFVVDTYRADREPSLAPPNYPLEDDRTFMCLRLLKE